ncbi:DUF2079 domain-containing protein [Candidatus Gottesmanbacteria bacterium]|nr:DUF2079 domain-containing protein [Candidatus Gottesmanbacteria bacterium]
MVILPILRRFSKILLLIIIFSFLYSFISIVKYNHFQTSLDLAIYVQTFWNYAHLKLPYVTLYPTNGDLVWVDHFSPSLFLLTPLFLLWQDPRMLLIIQSTLFMLGAYPIYRFSFDKFKSEALSISFAIVYIVFFGTQFALTTDFHEANIAAAFFPWIFWFMFRKQWSIFLILSLISLGFKEDVPIYMATIGVYMFISGLNKKIGMFLSVISIFYFFIISHYIMPIFVHYYQRPTTAPYFSIEYLNPIYIFFNSPIKIKTMILIFTNFLVLPIFSGYFLILPLIHLFINFTSPGLSGRWDIYMHYRVYLASIMSFAAIIGLANIISKYQYLKRKSVKIIIAILLIGLSVVFDGVLHLPLNTLLKPQFYRSESWMNDLDGLIKQIPPQASLLTTNQILAHAANRPNIKFYNYDVNDLKKLEQYEYILLDLRLNQSIINFWYSKKDISEMTSSIRFLIDNHLYEQYSKKNDAVLFKRL